MENINNNFKQVELKKEDISSLRDRALLAKKITPDYRYFIESINEVINISNTLEEINMKGYPKIIEVKIKLKVKVINNKENQEMKLETNKEYYIDDDLKNNYNDIMKKLKDNLLSLKEKQIEGYETKPLVRYVYGRQFNLLYNIFNKVQNNNINNFLKYVTNDQYKKEVKNFSGEEIGDIIENNINDCNNYLSQVLSINNINIHKIYEKTLIKEKNINFKLNGLFTYLSDNLEKNYFKYINF